MKLEKSCKKAVPSVLGLIHQTLGNRRLFASFFHLKWMQRTSENTLLFSFSHQALPRKCTSVSAREPSWCWTPVLLVPRQRVPHSPPLPTSERTFMAQCPSPFPCLPLLARSSCFQGCYYAHSEIFIYFFFFRSLHFNYMSSISKGWMFWDNEMFPQVMLLSLPLDSSINRKLLVSRRKLSWFLYSLNLFSLKPLANLLFTFQAHVTKPNAIRQRSEHILNHEQGLGSLVKSFIRATLKFLTK